MTWNISRESRSECSVEGAVGSAVNRELRAGSRRSYHRVDTRELNIWQKNIPGRKGTAKRGAECLDCHWVVQGPGRPVAGSSEKEVACRKVAGQVWRALA